MASNGKIRFDINYAGNGTGSLIVGTYYPNGGPGIAPGERIYTAYNLTNGNKINPNSVTGNFEVGVENRVIASDAGFSSGAGLYFSLAATPPSPNPWEIVTPPTAGVKITIPPGQKRYCIFTVSVTGNIGSANEIQAWAYNPASIAADGTVLEQPGVVSVVVSGSGANMVSTINASFYLENTASDSSGSEYEIYLVIPKFENQAKPKPSDGYGEHG